MFTTAHYTAAEKPHARGADLFFWASRIVRDFVADRDQRRTWRLICAKLFKRARSHVIKKVSSCGGLDVFFVYCVYV